jgi:hypothetical protein
MISSGFFKNPTTEYFDTISQQINNIGSLKTNNETIRNKMNQYNTIKTDLNTNYKDYKGDYLDYSDEKKTVKDAVKEDTHIMILQQNNSYIMGMITIATILITTYLVIKK